MGLPSEGVVWIHGLYVSWALHRGGFGAAVMDQVEQLVAEAPIGAKVVALDTLDEKIQLDPNFLKLMYVDRGIPPPRVREGPKLLVGLENGTNLAAFRDRIRSGIYE